MSQVNRSRLIATSAICATAVLLICFIPIPHNIWCDLYVQPRNSAAVYAKAPGRIKRILVEPNQYVSAGDVLMELDNVNLEAELADLKGKADVAQTRLQSALHMSNIDANNSGDVDTANASYVSLSNLAAQRQKDLEQLVIRAPIGGQLLAADELPKPIDDDGKLIGWYGRALDQRNVGAQLIEGTNIGSIVPDNAQSEAILAVDQSDIEFIASGQPVEIWIRGEPGRTFSAKIEQVALTEMKIVPNCLSTKFGGSVSTTTTAEQAERPNSTIYRVSVPFVDSSETITLGNSGRARVRVGYRSLGARLWRLICKTVRFDL